MSVRLKQAEKKRVSESLLLNKSLIAVSAVFNSFLVFDACLSCHL